MAEGKATRSESFDMDKFRQLVEMMEQYDLREVRLRAAGQSWMLKRGPQETVQAFPAFPPPAYAPPNYAPQPAVQAPAAQAQSATGSPAGPAAPAADSNLRPVKSPMVGTFYGAQQPGDPPFVKLGDRVSADTTVCLVEAMKFFNQIKAETAGTIAQVLVKDGDAVDFGQTLFLVQP